MQLPAPYLDELIGSVIARACWQYGLPLKTLLSSIYGKGRSSFSLLMPSNTLRLCELTGLSPEELVMNHTVFPYTVAFMNQEEQTQHLERILYLSRGIGSNAALTQSVSHGLPFRRACTDCIKDDIARHGEAYWHRAHNLPGVHLCNVHRIRLQLTNIPVRGEAQGGNIELPAGTTLFPSSIRRDKALLECLTTLSVKALHGQMLKEAIDWYGLYRSKVEKKGYKLGRNLVASKSMATDFRRFYGTKLLADSGCPVGPEEIPLWPSLMVRSRTSTAIATPKHILFQAFLELAPESDGTFSYGMPGKTVRDYARLDHIAARTVSRFLRRQSGSGERYTIRQLLDQADIREPFRHNRHAFPEMEKVLKTFRASDQAERQVGRRPYWRKRLGLEVPL
jgi:hypothetical protein